MWPIERAAASSASNCEANSHKRLGRFDISIADDMTEDRRPAETRAELLSPSIAKCGASGALNVPYSNSVTLHASFPGGPLGAGLILALRARWLTSATHRSWWLVLPTS
jgi:hypothetical protein